jgi:hypothetical protein
MAYRCRWCCCVSGARKGADSGVPSQNLGFFILALLPVFAKKMVRVGEIEALRAPLIGSSSADIGTPQEGLKERTPHRTQTNSSLIRNRNPHPLAQVATK